MTRVFQEGVNIVIDRNGSSDQVPVIDARYTISDGIVSIFDEYEILPIQNIPLSDLQDGSGTPLNTEAAAHAYFRPIIG